MEELQNSRRRAFLKASAAVGGGLVISIYLPSLAAAAARAKSKASSARTFAPNVWLRIGTDDSVTIIQSQIEMGQGVMTSMPMLVAEELDVDWNKVRLEWAPADLAYGNPQMRGAQLTAGSQSTRGYWKILREAGAAARAMLVTAGAATWGVPENSCSTDKGEVIHTATGRRLRYGALVEKASALTVPKDVALKNPSDFRLLGHPLARLDVPEKVDGKAVFGIDVKLPNLLVARVLRSPVFGGRVKSFEAAKAKGIPGVRQVVQVGSGTETGADPFWGSTRGPGAGIAVVADTFWSATRGLKALDVTWDEGSKAELSSGGIRIVVGGVPRFINVEYAVLRI